jgi:hypothetical protein
MLWVAIASRDSGISLVREDCERPESGSRLACLNMLTMGSLRSEVITRFFGRSNEQATLCMTALLHKEILCRNIFSMFLWLPWNANWVTWMQ